MMKNRIKIGIIFGGQSAEHEVSIKSAGNIIKALDNKKYAPTKIYINKKGDFNINKIKKMDVIFPVLHGPFGEDGTIQGLLKLLGIPFVGSGVLGSAIGMDKEIMKKLLKEAKIPIGKFVAIKKNEKVVYTQIVKKLGLPTFVKPANLGSSIGISKATNETEFKKAVKLAFKYDNKIILEEFINGREMECSILGNNNPKASEIGEIKTSQEFYSYDAKYKDNKNTQIEIPAKINKNVSEKIKKLATKTFRVLNCEGFGRIDFFLTETGKILVNEINTIPGFTSKSMYPKLWEASGIKYQDLINKLIELAFEKFGSEKKLENCYKK